MRSGLLLTLQALLTMEHTLALPTPPPPNRILGLYGKRAKSQQEASSTVAPDWSIPQVGSVHSPPPTAAPKATAHPSIPSPYFLTLKLIPQSVRLSWGSRGNHPNCSSWVFSDLPRVSIPATSSLPFFTAPLPAFRHSTRILPQKSLSRLPSSPVGSQLSVLRSDCSSHLPECVVWGM